MRDRPSTLSAAAIDVAATTALQRRLRIGIIAPPWLPIPPTSYGGTENVIDDLATGLVAAGHDVVLYSSGDSTCRVRRRWTYGAAQRGRMGESVVELRHVLDAHEALDDDVDIIHDHTLVGPALAATTPLRVPTVTTCHGQFDEETRPIYRRVATKIPVIAISHHQSSTATDVPVAAVIHHGVDVGRFPVGAGDGDYVLFLGRMSSGKGVDVAARVAIAAGVPLKIAAKMREPAEREFFERRVRPLLGPTVEYLGEVGGTEKLEILGRARALLNPIRWNEPFGMVMIEALACGTPVIATPRGSVPEIVDDNVTGRVVSGRPALVEALADLERLDRAACRAAAELRFSAHRMVDDHVQLYRRLLGTTVDLTRSDGLRLEVV